MRPCEEVRTKLAAGEELGPGPRQHLEQCAECQAFAKDAGHLAHLALSLPRPAEPPAAPAHGARRRQRRSWGIAVAMLAVALVLVAIVIVPDLIRPPAPDQERSAARQHSPDKERSAARQHSPAGVDLLADLGQAALVWEGSTRPEHLLQWMELPASSPPLIPELSMFDPTQDSSLLQAVLGSGDTKLPFRLPQEEPRRKP